MKTKFFPGSLTSAESNWALVSEPGFSDFSDLEIFEFWETHLKQSGFEIAKTNNKGVLGRPWTKRMVLRAISSTLNFQFTEKHAKLRFDYSVRQKIGDPGP